jgi:hypothetical protein
LRKDKFLADSSADFLLLFLIGDAPACFEQHCWSLLLVCFSLLLCSRRNNIVLMFLSAAKRIAAVSSTVDWWPRGERHGRDNGTESTGVLTAPLWRMCCEVDMVVYAYMHDIRPSSRIFAEKRG